MTATRAITIGLCFMLWAVVPNCTNAAVSCGTRVTRQFTAYGQVWREFDAYYDWMHHGEARFTPTTLASPIRLSPRTVPAPCALLACIWAKMRKP